VGAIAGGLLTSTHERTERFRERMLAAAEAFLAAAERMRAAIGRLEEVGRLYTDARDQTYEAVANALAAKPEDKIQSEAQFLRALDASTELNLVVAQYAAVPFDTDTDARLRDAEAAVSDVLAALKSYEGPLRGEMEALLRVVTEHGRRARQTIVASRAMVDALADLGSHTPRIRVLFARGEKDDPVTTDAFAVASHAGTLANAVVHRLTSSAGGAPASVANEPEPLPDSNTYTPALTVEVEESDGKPDAEARAELNRAVGRFAGHVSERIRKRWL